MELNLLSGGAAQGVVTRLAARFQRETGHTLAATFSAVGAMKEKLLAGAPVDAVILTRAVVEELAALDHVDAATFADLGGVSTGVAVRAGEPAPELRDAAALRDALRAARGIYVPDPQRATAGIHFMKMLDTLGIGDEVRPRLRPHPNGNAAMRAMALAQEAGLIGCTQITEIRNTPGVTLVGALPAGLGLTTVYTAAVCTRASAPDAARRLVALLVDDETRPLRREAGFDV